MAQLPLHGLERFDLGSYPRLRCTLPATWRTDSLVLPEHLLYICLSGFLSIEFREIRWDLAPGDACQVAAGTAFVASAKGGSRLRIARVRWHGPLTGNQRWSGLEEIEPVLALLEQRLLAGDAGPTEHRALAVLLAAALGRSRDGAQLAAAQVARLRARIAANPAATPGDLARELGLSHDYASRLIRRSLGQPPRRFILAERLRLAADRLASGEAWQQVADELAWNDRKLFLRQFRVAFGDPPGRWRRRLA